MATLTFYKATRLDGTSFYDGTTEWRVGRIVQHPAPDLSLGLCSAGVLHISDAPGETPNGGWPCRLFEVEPRGDMIGPEGHKYGCTKVKVVRELPAWQVFGPNGEAVATLIKRCRTLTYDEAEQLSAAWNAAKDAARDAARDAAWDAAWPAARAAAWAIAWHAAGVTARATAWDAAIALVVEDLITPKQFDFLYGPWASVMGS
ncbi:MAG: hypothetical protein ACLP1E_15280 [Acidimicrobiales bacterium]